jgi:hypothetical protein
MNIKQILLSHYLNKNNIFVLMGSFFSSTYNWPNILTKNRPHFLRPNINVSIDFKTKRKPLKPVYKLYFTFFGNYVIEGIRYSVLGSSFKFKSSGLCTSLISKPRENH